MTETETKALVAAFIDRLDRRDWEAFAEVLHRNLIYEIPQTRERIRGRDRYVTFNIQYPGEWRLYPKVILGDAERGVVLFRWENDGEDFDAVAFFEVADGLITKVVDYWPEPYEPPPGREHLVERW